MTFLNIGFDNMVATDKIVAIVSPEGASVKRLVQYARENHLHFAVGDPDRHTGWTHERLI